MALSIIFWKFILFDMALKYGYIVDILISTNCVPHLADLFVFCYERRYVFSFLDYSTIRNVQSLKII